MESNQNSQEEAKIYTKEECERIGREYYLQNQIGNISKIKCPVPVCKDGVVIFGIQGEGEKKE